MLKKNRMCLEKHLCDEHEEAESRRAVDGFKHKAAPHDTIGYREEYDVESIERICHRDTCLEENQGCDTRKTASDNPVRQNKSTESNGI